MHPATSVIVFTASSGAGYGLLFLLGLCAAFGLLPPDRWIGFCGMGLALGLITLGLLSSTFHLGHPERAWRALSQWRSSWLSREGVMAIATYVPAGLLGIGWVFLERTDGFWSLMALLAAVGAVFTVVCTAMIYASLKTIRQWHNGYVPPIYLALSLASGLLWLNALASLFSAGNWGVLTLIALVCAWGLKLAYWRMIDRDDGGPTTATATALEHLGPVRLLEPPHTESNYLMREMGFRVARKHAEKLRRFALIGGAGVPVVLILIALAAGGVFGALLSLLAAITGTAGILIERWLFFAEAKHSVSLYYDA